MTSLVLEGVGVPDGLVEERRQTDVKTLGALATINQVRVGYMALVVLGINILAVPARREEEFGTDTVGAVGIHVRLVGQEVTETGTFRSLVVVEAVEAKRLLRESALGHIFKTP